MISLINSGIYYSSDGFIVKFDNSGNILWAKGMNSIKNVNVRSLALDNNGNAYVVGFCDTVSTFSGMIISGGSFVAKYYSDGTIAWVKQISQVHYWQLKPELTIPFISAAILTKIHCTLEMTP